MATVTAFTAARMQEIEDNTIVDGHIVSGDLILVKHNGEELNAGSVGGGGGYVPDTDDYIQIRVGGPVNNGDIAAASFRTLIEGGTGVVTLTPDADAEWGGVIRLGAPGAYISHHRLQWAESSTPPNPVFATLFHGIYGGEPDYTQFAVTFQQQFHAHAQSVTRYDDRDFSFVGPGPYGFYVPMIQSPGGTNLPVDWFITVQRIA